MSKRKNEYVRASISIPIEHYRELEALAQMKKVSMAWIVRDAIENYLTRNENDDKSIKTLSVEEK